MIIDESIANIKRTAGWLKDNDPKFAQQPPVIATPRWWLDELKAHYQAAMPCPDAVVDTIDGCKVIQRDDLQEPFVISGGGKVYPVLPGWVRAANVGKDGHKLQPVDSIFAIEPAVQRLDPGSAGLDPKAAS